MQSDYEIPKGEFGDGYEIVEVLDNKLNSEYYVVKDKMGFIVHSSKSFDKIMSWIEDMFGTHAVMSTEQFLSLKNGYEHRPKFTAVQFN